MPDPDWKVQDQPGVRARTSGGNKNKDNDDQGGDIPAWMFKKSNQEKTEKRAPRREYEDQGGQNRRGVCCWTSCDEG